MNEVGLNFEALRIFVPTRIRISYIRVYKNWFALGSGAPNIFICRTYVRMHLYHHRSLLALLRYYGIQWQNNNRVHTARCKNRLQWTHFNCFNCFYYPAITHKIWLSNYIIIILLNIMVINALVTRACRKSINCFANWSIILIN